MRRSLSIWVLVIAIVGFSWAAFATSTQAQSDAATPATGDSASPTPSDTIWFVIIPEGKANGDYFDVELDPGESATLNGTFGNGSEIPVEAVVYVADAYSGHEWRLRPE